MYGFTEIPYISCESLSPNPDGSLSRNDDRTSPNITEYTDRDDCIENKRNSLPAILFFIKFQKELEPGSYELIITIHDRDVADIQKFTYTFAVNPDFRLNYNPFTSIPAVQKQLFGDFCSGHYGFSSPEEKESYLEIPLPKIHSADVNYRIVFPQTLEETIKGHQDRIAYIQFDDNIFDLIIPNSWLYYHHNSGRPIRSGGGGGRYLHIPKSLLVFGNKSQITPASLPEHTGIIYPSSYLELLPEDSGGKKYHQELLQHFTTSSSSCDG